MAITYGITEEIYSLGGMTRVAYGIAVYTDAEQDGTASILLSVPDITSDRDKLWELIQKCNRLALSPVHLYDVIDDFLAN